MDLMEIDNRGEGHLTNVDGVDIDLNDPNIDLIPEPDPDKDYDIHISEYVYKPPVSILKKVKKPIKIEPNRKKQAFQPWQHGIKCAIKTIRALFIDLVEHGVLVIILTKRLNQDCLENLFSQIRALCADNNHPGPVGIQRRYRILMI